MWILNFKIITAGNSKILESIWTSRKWKWLLVVNVVIFEVIFLRSNNWKLMCLHRSSDWWETKLSWLNWQGRVVFFQVELGILYQSVQSLSHVQLFATPWTATHQASLSRPLCPSPTPGVYSSTMSIELVMHNVHWIGDAIQPSHPLSSPSPPALNLAQHQGLFKWVSSLHQVAKVLEFQLQHQSFQWTPRTDLL